MTILNAEDPANETQSHGEPEVNNQGSTLGWGVSLALHLVEQKSANHTD